MILSARDTIEPPVDCTLRQGVFWRYGTVLIAGGFGMLAVLFLLLASPWGLNLTSDSPSYVSMARNVVHGNGLGVIDPDGRLRQETHFAPMYPLVLALTASASGLEVLAAARWFQAGVFGLTVLLVCLTVAQYNLDSLLAPTVAGLFTIFGGSLLVWFGSLMTEGLFILCGLVGLLLLATYLKHSRLWILVASAAATAAALLTRYAGLPLVATGIALVLLSDTYGLRRKMWSAGLFGTLSTLPLLLWLASHAATGSFAQTEIPDAQQAVASGTVVADRAIGIYAAIVVPHLLTYGPLAIARWIVPEGLLRAAEALFAPVWYSGLLGRTLLVVLAMACAGGGIRRLLPRTRWHPPFHLGTGCRVVIVFVPVYVGFLVLTMLVAKPSTELSQRTLAPVYLALVMLLPSVLLAWWRSLRGLRIHQLVLAGLVGLVLGGQMIQSGLWVWDGNLHGLGLGRRAFQDSSLLERARAVPPVQQVYTNGGVLMALYTDRLFDELPRTTDESYKYRGRAETIKTRLQQHTAVLVYFDELLPPDYPYPSINEFGQSIPLRVVYQEPDGAVYTAD